MLFILNIYTSPEVTDLSISYGTLDYSVKKQDDMTKLSSNHAPVPRVASEITFGKTNITTDKDTYAPGEWMTITAESNSDEMNGSLEWQLESPIGEVAFDFYSDFQNIFEDPTFDNTTVLDWKNEGFDFVETPLDYLNLTTIPDIDEDAAEIFYNSTTLDPGRYLVSFQYKSQGKNLLKNPSFETNDTSGWYGSISNVTVVSDPTNASDGSHYASINATEGMILYQNITDWTGGRTVTFSAKATGTSVTDYWTIKLEAFNSTGHSLGSTSVNSQDSTPDESGYAFNQIMNWKTPLNTTKLQVSFHGYEDTYIGWLDDCYLADVPPKMIFSYWGEDKKWKEKPLSSGSHEWISTGYREYIIDIGKNLSKTFRFILPDDNSFANNATSYWLLDNITVNLVTAPDKKWDPITNVGTEFKGEINSTWIHMDGTHENLTSKLDVVIDEPINGTSDCHVTIDLELPSYKLFFGSWIFMLMIHQIDDANQFINTQAINISFIVEDQLNYVVQDIFVLRGSTNVTVGNDSVFTEYFEQETNIPAISPGDNVTLIGYLEANSSKGKWYDLSYLQQGEVSDPVVEFRWSSNWPSRDNISWSEIGFIPFDKSGETILDGNFPSPWDNTSTMGLNFQIPNRGIIGNIIANLTFTLTGTNERADGQGGEPLDYEIPLNLPPVEFQVKVIEENLPTTSYYLTDYLSGNITLEFFNINDTLESVFSNRNISSKLDIPMTDLYLTIFLNDLDHTPEVEISQEFHYHYLGKTVVWLDYIDPHLLSGTYAFIIRWNTPYKLGYQDLAMLNISAHNIEIKGILKVISSGDAPKIEQGDQTVINFSVHLDNATGKFIGGLNLQAISEQTNESYTIYEEDNMYFVTIDVDPDLELSNYTIQILVLGRHGSIGELSYTVIERPIIPTDVVTPLDVIIEFGGFGLFLLVGFVVVGLLYWSNKKLK